MKAAILCSVPEGFVPEQEDGRAVLEVKKKVPPFSHLLILLITKV